VIFKVVPDETIAAQQLKTGEADMAVVSPTYLAEMELQDNLTLHQHFDDGFTYMAFNMGDPANPQPRLDEQGNPVEDHGVHPILGDVLVRQAIVHAIDRQVIIDRVNFGQGAALNSFVLPAVEWAYNDELPGREYDLEKAAALLEEAGWTDEDGDGVRECHSCKYAEEGTPLELNLRTNAGNERRENTGLIVQDELGKLGFKVEFEAMEWNAFLDTLLNQTFDMIIIGWTDMGSDPDGSDLYTSQNDVPGAGFNFVSYYNPLVDELMQKALTVPGCSVDRRGPIYRELQQILYDDQPYDWLFVPRDTFAYNSKISGINPGPWDYYHNIQEWYIK
jgi:peptide/nickel transport system substrate-binding protein